MFKSPPSHIRHVQTRGARRKEEQNNTMKADQGREIQSEIIKTTNVEKISLLERPKTEIGSFKNAESEKSAISKNSRSVKSIEARKKMLEFEAAQAKAQIDKKLIEQKLAADVAALESQASKSRQGSKCQRSEVDSLDRVQQWLEKSHVTEMQNNAMCDDVNGAAGGNTADLQNLASAIYQSNSQNKQILARFATSKDLPPFHGDPLEWLAFKQAYDESSRICNYTDGENMWRLRKSLRGEAKETVAALLIGNTAPQPIIDALVLRYGRPETIISKITYQLKKVPPLSSNYHQEIVSFAIKIKNYVAAVQAVNETDYLRSPELVTSVLTKCPSALINKWADYYCVNCNTSKAKLEVLADFLYCEANKISAAGLSNIHSLADYKKKTDDRKHSVLLGNNTEVTNQCKFCRTGNHTLAGCARFKRAMTKDRWRYVRVNKLCHKCMVASHNRDTCSAASCDVDECGLPHHRLLHWKTKSSEKKSSESDNIADKSDNVLISDCQENSNSDSHVDNETVAHAITSSESSVFLKVVPVNVHGPHGVVSTYALLDDGATISLISADIADHVNLHGRKQTLCVRGAWDSELTCESEIVNFKISNINSETFELCARKIGELNLPLQKLSNINTKNYEHLNQLDSFITFSGNVKPKLLIGQDNYHLIAPIKTIIRNKNEPCATLTPLGWCVHGVCPMQLDKKTAECAMITVAQRRRLSQGPAAVPDSHHACLNCASLLTAPLTGAIVSSDASPHRMFTTVNAKECACLHRSNTVIHTDSENDAQLHELVKKSFTFESIGVHNKPRQNKDELRAVNIVESSAKLINGRWEVSLPWKDKDAKMASSFCNAYRRLQTAERKMTVNDGYAARYKERVQHLFANNYARMIDSNQENGDNITLDSKVWYLPHFGVDNPKIEKLRLVFDAAAKSGGHSLNDYLLQGPDLLESLFGIMLRFREKPVGLTGDIKDMFLRVTINPKDQNALRFLWRTKPDEPVQKCKMTSLIFGANCSPFIAQYVKNKNALRFSDQMPDAVTSITKHHYVDDFIQSFDDKDATLKIMNEVTYIHRQGGFEIRNWTSNEPQVCQSIPNESLSQAAVRFKIEEDNLYERTLGLLWYPGIDSFGFNLSFHHVPDKILKCQQRPTKRELLRIVMSIFDIYGLLTPFTIKAKIIIQNTWKSNTSWDEQIPNKQYEAFCGWIKQLNELKEIRIPRWYFRSMDRPNYETLELHIFCDASPSAYAAVAYWRAHSNNNNVCVSFIASKSRVAPVRHVTIPRLELQAAVLACRLAETIQTEHRLQPTKRYFWSDSTTVLHWIRNDTRNYKVFIANRLGEIDELSNSQEWYYVPSDKNMADVATKNNTYKLNNDCEWFRGPEILHEKHDEMRSTFVPEKENIISEETLETIHTVYNTADNEYLPVPDPAKFSKWLRLLRCTGTVLLFIEKCKKSGKSEIDVEILQRAEMLIIHYAQKQSFSTEINLLRVNKQIPSNSRLRTLTPYLDEWGILRVGGRIQEAVDISSDIKRPIILDGHNLVARLITKHYHEKSAHGNNEMVVNELRQKYWLVNLRPTVRTVASRCLICRIKKTLPSAPRMADLPESRLAHHQRAFTYCGVDLFGPIEVTVGRRRERRYGVLFTCMTVRAVHIEVVPSLTTDSFIMALRRMASRRGWPQYILSDNGTNLRGAEKELRQSFRELNQTQIKEEMTNRGVSWSFISPNSPHKGGAWERLIRSTKAALKVILKERAPREETLTTLLLEVENIINSRPLTHVSVDPKHMEALTPNHFLIGCSSNLPVPGVFDDSDLYLRKLWRVAQRLTDMFWQRWVREYLPELIPRQKWYKEGDNLKIGDLVIMIDPNLPRNTWPMGKIEKVYPGRDGRVRTVEVKTKKGIFTRPVTRLALLPKNDECP